MIRFFIAGEPKSTQTGSVIRAGNRAFPIKRNTPWSAVCGEVARAHAPKTPLTEALMVRLTFGMPRPKTARRRVWPTVRPDIDGLCKGILDSWNGVLWADDSQVVRLTLQKIYTDKPGIAVEVEAL